MDGYIIIGNMNAVTYNAVFPLIRDGKVRLGKTFDGRNKWFYTPDEYEVQDKAAGYKVENGRKMLFVNSPIWLTTFPVERKPLVLTESYTPERYPRYDDYDAINVDKVAEIPYDYYEPIGVPITFLTKYTDGFEILDNLNPTVGGGRKLYKRVIIRRLRNE